jgi:hypothetical protein
VHRLRAGIAAMAASLGGLDTLVFAGGVGERSATAAAAGLGFLGVALDPERNATASGDADIGARAAVARTLVVEAREDLEIARQVRAVVAAGRGAPAVSTPRRKACCGTAGDQCPTSTSDLQALEEAHSGWRRSLSQGGSGTTPRPRAVAAGPQVDVPRSERAAVAAFLTRSGRI